jgi:hypothetical protein
VTDRYANWLEDEALLIITAMVLISVMAADRR